MVKVVGQRRRLWGTGTWSGRLALLMMLCLVLDAQDAVAAVKEGMLLLVRSIIPSLFPFMVVSEWIVRSGAGEGISRVAGKGLRSLLGIGEAAGCACLLGFLCGFPVGSRAAANYYRAGRLSDWEFSRVVCVCNLPSTAFLVSAVGVCLFGSARVGWSLVVISLGAALVTGVLFRFLLPRGTIRALDTASPLPETSATGEGTLAASISAAAGNMLGICATVLLFCALTGVVSRFCRLLGVGRGFQVVMMGLLELSGGVCGAAGLSLPLLSPVLCAAFVGWGGLSVHCQIFSVCRGCPFPRGWFWLSRALQALLCGGGMALWMRLGGLVLPEPTVWRDIAAGVRPLTSDFTRGWSIACVAIFVCGLCCFVCKRRKKEGA